MSVTEKIVETYEILPPEGRKELVNFMCWLIYKYHGEWLDPDDTYESIEREAGRDTTPQIQSEAS